MKDKKQKKKKFQWGFLIGMILFMLIGAACGILMVMYIEKFDRAEKTFEENMFALVILFISMYAAMFLQIIIHEGGHLIFGLLTGYHFSSFRIGSFMWINENGKLKFKRLSLTGTGGQCLMNPPEMKDGKLPYVLYNLGGSINNVISAVVFLALFLVVKDSSVFAVVLLMLAIIGIVFAIMNGVPLHMGAVDNDGYNALSLGKDEQALRSFWVQMKVSNEQIYGIRLKDMPEEWFAFPSDEAMENGITAVMGVFACNRLMDQKRFAEADEQIKRILEMKSGIVGVHRNLLTCDRIYCELIRDRKENKIDTMLDKQQKSFMKSMKKFPTVIRTEYVYALLKENDQDKASKIMDSFEKTAKTYPYLSDIESERELMEFADEIFKCRMES